MKYIVKNCPSYEYDKDWDQHICKRNLAIYEIKSYLCQDCTDCVMKQIVSRLNNFAEDYGLDAGFYADELLSYLNIQEVE